MDLLLSRHDQSIQEYIFRVLAGHHQNHEKAYLVVPEQFTLQSDIHLLEALHINASMDIRVKSFSSLANEVLGRVGTGGRVYLNEIGRELLVRQAFEDKREALRFFAADSSNTGVVSAITKMIAELRIANITATDFIAASEGNALAESTCKKIHDMAVLLSRYDELLGDKYLDVEARLFALQEALPQADWLKDIHFYFYGFHSMSRLELDILGILARENNMVHVSVVLPPAAAHHETMPQYVAENDAFRAGWKFFKQLVALTPQHTITPIEDSAQIPMSLRVLANDAFHWRMGEQKQQAEEVSFQQAVNSEQEVMATAQMIRHRVIKDHMRYRDFTIAVANPDEYFPLVRRVFRAHDIPVFIDQKKKVTDNPFVRALLSAVAAVESNLHPDDVFSYLKSGFSGIDRKTVLAYERHVRNRKLRGPMLWTDKYFNVDETRFIGRADTIERLKEETALARTGAQQFKEQMESFYLSCRQNQTVRFFATMLYHFITQPPIKHRLETFQQTVQEKNNEALASENEQILQLLVDFFEQLVTGLGDREVSFSDFAELFRHGLEILSVGIIPPAQDQVLVGSLNRTRTRQTPYQLILGMADLWLPSSQDDNAVFLREEKEDLAKLGFDLPSSEVHQLDDEVLSLYQAFTRPTKKLVLSWPLSDHSGQTVNKARIVNHILGHLNEPKILSAMVVSERLKAYSEPVALSHTMSDFRRWQKDAAYLEDDHNAELVLGSYFRYFLNRSDERKWFLTAGLAYSNKRQRLPKVTVRSIYRAFNKQKTSITELEAFRACPYKHFIRFGLKPVEESQMDIERREIGTLVHTVLNRFTMDMSKDPSVFLSQTKEEIDQLIDDYIIAESAPLLGKERMDNKRNRAVLDQLTKTTKKAGNHIVRQLRDGQFDDVQQEVFFGKKDGLPQIVLQVGDENIFLEGSIDRIDTCDDRIRVIDYKTGSKTFDLTRALDGLDLQLLLYLRVALSLKEAGKPAGVFYLNLNDVLVKDESDDFQEIQKALIDTVLMDGLIVQDPDVIEAMDKDACDGVPKVLRFRGKKKNVLEKDNVVSEQTIIDLTERAFQIAETAVAEIAEGIIDVYPAKIGKERVCTYCTYKGMCRYEEGMPERDVKQYQWSELSEIESKMEGGESVD